MKFLINITVSILLAGMILSVVPIKGETEIYNDVLRFHVRAVSDSDYDQEIKLKVRDAVLEYISCELDNCETYDEARAIVEAQIPSIKEVAEEVIRTNKYDCSVSVELTEEVFPRIDYGDAVMPAGKYNSLTITLGEGNGHNWWCVLFPTVCVRLAKADESDYVAAGFTPEEYRIITGNSKGWRVRFRLLEILSDVFDFNY